ncbi:DnaJ protein like [Dendrobium catenatum]|uniref:DnaJ protein like n=1 Tax=Dendrobium catenatum TaxID=906689 RepID=A0A2I0X6K3_9ASPA|nr:DnaJ protein like [Dendrobium catenatum]
MWKSDGFHGFGYGMAVAMGIFLLITAVTLIIYYFLRWRNIRADEHQSDAVVEAELADVEQGIDETTLKSFPKVIYGEDEVGSTANDPFCSICLLDYTDAQILRLLPDCRHIFHAACVDEWLQQHPTCPICRCTPLTYFDVRCDEVNLSQKELWPDVSRATYFASAYPPCLGVFLPLPPFLMDLNLNNSSTLSNASILHPHPTLMALSWANNISAPNATSDSFPISFVPPSHKLSFSIEELLEGTSLWSLSLVGYWIGKCPYYKCLLAAMNKVPSDDEVLEQPVIALDGPAATYRGSSRGRRQKRGEDVIHPLKVSLEELYNGTSKKLSLSRNVLCSKCKGKGSKSGASMKCSGCEDALCGFRFVLTHLDGRQLLIKSNPGEVVKPDQFKAINDEGMPMYQRPFMKGKLYIHFNVEFPDSLNPDQCKALEAILPARTRTQLTDMELDECEETTLHDVNMEEEMRRKQQTQAQEAYDEDEDMHGGAQRVQCAQQ